ACIDGGPACDGPDACNGVDDDCDRRIDEDFVAENITCGQGICEAEGTTQCVDGSPVSVCVTGQPQDGPDGCGGGDTDCDGETDEDFVSQRITCGRGICRASGNTQCIDGNPVSACVPGQPQLGPDGCGGGDTDCDGLEDEDCSPRCSRNVDGRCLSNCPEGFRCDDACVHCEIIIR
ncbi:MAG: hypothetical protein VX589_04535, partial [Myxococcota bacterium]|nr:hypothetical protein [Myxococcota bacterium]